MTSTPDPLWDRLPGHVDLTPPPPPEPEPERPRDRRVWLAVVLAALVVALAGWAAWATYAMLENEDRAVGWQKRAQALEARTRRAEGILTSRTRELNTRIAQLNTLGARLAESQAALRRSEGDVSSLEQRQRELAAEKARIEDQARALDGVAAAYVRCKEDLVDLLGVVSSDLASTSAFREAQGSCTSADLQLDAYASST